MKQQSFLKRLLCMVLTVALLAGNVIPVHVHAAEETDSVPVSFTRVEDEMVSAGLTPNDAQELENQKPYADTDIVRVSIVLEKASVIEAGFDLLHIAGDEAAAAYRTELKDNHYQSILRQE